MMLSIERLYRRILTVIGRGRIKIVDDSASVQRMQVYLGYSQTMDGLTRLAEYGHASNPPVDTDALVVFLGGDRSKGVVIATNNQTYRMKGLKTGEVALYDDLGQSVYLTRSGIVVNGGGLPVKVTNTPEVTHDAPLVYMTGDLMVKGNISDQDGLKGTLQHVRDNYDMHTHGNVQNGTGNTSTPNNTL